MTIDSSAKSVVFIVTKPLQLIIAEMLREQCGYSNAQLIVLEGFSNARRISELILDSGRWRQVNCVADIKAAHKKVISIRHIDVLFVHADVGLRHHLLALRLKRKNRNIEIAVYEEGTGSYRSSVINSRFKQKVYAVVGAGSRYAGNRFSDLYYVFTPSQIPKKHEISSVSIRLIKENLASFVQANQGYFERCFEIPKDLLELEGSCCCIYLSSWSIDQEFIERKSDLAPESAIWLLKLHPHIKDSIDPQGFHYSVPSHIPAELLIPKMAAKFKKLIVFHHGSSAVLYTILSNVEFHRITGEYPHVE